MRIPTTTRPRGGFRNAMMAALFLFSAAACKMPLISKDMLAAATLERTEF